MASVAINDAEFMNNDEEKRLRERLKRRQETRQSSTIDSHPEDEKKDDRLRRDGRGHPNPNHRHSRGPPSAGPAGHNRRRDRPSPPPYHRGHYQNPARGPPHPIRPPPARGPVRPGYHRRPPSPPPHYRRRSPSRSPSSSSSRSYSRSRSRSPPRRRSRSYSSDSYSSRSRTDESSVSSRSSSEESDLEDDIVADNVLTKDQRTVFVSQLVMRAGERDLRKYFKKTLHCKVNDVIILRDKRTNRHKGCAYVELARVEDIAKALEASNQPPDFQRFPILIKASEAEKNYVLTNSQLTLTAKQMGAKGPSGPLIREGKLFEAQKVYLGNLDPSVSQELLYSVFSKFGHLEKVAIQMDPVSGTSRGFAFLSYRDPKDANLAIHTMSGQVIGGRPLKTGWANQGATVPGIEIVTSTEFPDDAAVRIQNAHLILSQVSGTPTAPSRPLQMGAPASRSAVDDAKVVGNAANPTNVVLVHNMFDKDLETEPNWEEDIRLDFEEECTKWGKIISVKVMNKEVGGKIYASFETVSQAQTCASNLAGRWFDKRQLRVEFVKSLPV